MARIRTVKPEFFRHEGLQDLEAANVGKYPMLVFEGLWGHCDKAGRFEWRPRTLKLDILPFLPFDMAETLGLLADAGFIERYEVGGKAYGLVKSFAEHQRLSGKEAQEPEKFPEPSVKTRGSVGECPGEETGSNGEATGKHPVAQEGKGREEERKEEGKEGGADAPEAEDGLSETGTRQPSPQYRWQGKVIHLKDQDYAQWRRTYTAIPDFDAELFAADCYYADHPPQDGKWFFPVSNWLKKAHQDAKTRAAARPPPDSHGLRGRDRMHSGAGG